MIGRLRGRVLTDEATGAVVLDVHGVGYDVLTPVGTLGRARVDAQREVELWIHTHVREDALDLFGFATETDRRVFRLLLAVPNVGPKTALGVLSAMPVDELSRAVERGDHARLGKIPGIGKKTAERLVLELKEKLRGLDSSVSQRAGRNLGKRGRSPAQRVGEYGLPTRGGRARSVGPRSEAGHRTPRKLTARSVGQAHPMSSRP